MALVRPPVGDLPITQFRKVGALVLNSGGIALAYVDGSAQDHDAIIDLPDVLNFEAESRPRLKDICKGASYTLVAPIAPTLQDVPRQQKLGVWVEAVDPPLRISGYERPKRRTNQLLPVLLRHRPRSIPQAQESA